MIGLWLCVSASLYSQELEYDVGTNAAIEILFHMPGITGSEIGTKLAQSAGKAKYKGVYYVDNKPVLSGANMAGSRNLTVTITADHSYSGTITGELGIKVADISGSLTASAGISIQGTFNMSFTWDTIVADNGQLVVIYSIAVGPDTRSGAIITDLNIKSLPGAKISAPKPIEDDERAALPTSGRLIGDYWYRDKWTGTLRPAFYEGGSYGSISGPLIVISYW